MYVKQINIYIQYQYQQRYKIQKNNQIQKPTMTWYQSQQQSQQYQLKKLLQKQPINISQIVNNQQFCTQLIKYNNVDILTWIQNNYILFFQYMIQRCLVLPAQSDSYDRKYKQPTNSIYLLSHVIDNMYANMTNNMNNINNINNSINNTANNITCSYSGKYTSVDIISYIIDRTFIYYCQNNANKLINTLIPGYFNRIFECLNKSHSFILINLLKTTHQGKLQKLLDQHGKYQQVIKCIQNVLIVFVNQSITVTNLLMSTTFPNTNSSSVMVNNNSHLQQPNHPYQTKYRLLMTILQKIKNYSKIDICLLQNLMNVILQILKNINIIFQGNSLGDYICQSNNVHILFQIALSSMNQDSIQYQIKCFQVLKYCLNLMTSIDRLNLVQKFRCTIAQILNTIKPNLKMNSMVDLINQWFLLQSGQMSNLNSSFSMRSSLNYSMTNSSTRIINQIPIQVQQVLSTGKLFQHLLKLCVISPNCNIFHQKVANFISTIFKSQNQAIIESIFKQNQIIKETILNVKDFKQNPYFGYFLVIIQIYTTRRINTPIVDQIISNNNDIWNKFYVDILEPHMTQKLRNKLGEMENVKDPEPLEYTVTKKQQEFKKNIEVLQKKQVTFSNMQNNLKQNNFPIQLNNEKTDIKQPKQKNAQNQKQVQQQCLEPISLKFTKKQLENTEQKTESQSFQSFLKRKMSEKNNLVDQRKKSRTPTKMISGESKKKKKWGNLDQSDTQMGSARKTISADQKTTPRKIVQPQQIIPKISFIKQRKEIKPSKRQRKINQQNDSLLLKWLEKAKKNVKILR